MGSRWLSKRAITTTQTVIIIVIIVVAAGVGAYYATLPGPTTTSTTTATTIAATTTTTAPTTTSTSTTTTTLPKPKFKIAVVSDVGGRGDLAFNDMGFKGGDEAARDFGIESVELISNVAADRLPNLRLAARDPDVKLIVAVGFLHSFNLPVVAKEFPDKNFAGIDTFAQALVNVTLPNVLDIVYEEHKGSAIVGALGAFLAAHYNKSYIGGVFGEEIPPLWKFEIGYKWGVDWAANWTRQNRPELANVGIFATPRNQRVLCTYTGTFSDITKGFLAAVPMYEKGAVAVYNIAGPLGIGINQAVQDIALTKGLARGPPFWIGVDADQDWINPGFVIASMMKRVDKGVYFAAKSQVDGTFRDLVTQTKGTITLGIGTTVAGQLFEGISVSTLDDLATFIQFGIDAEKLSGRKILPFTPEQTAALVKEMRDAQPSWIWQAVAELEAKIRSGEVIVPAVQTRDAINLWRGIYGPC